MTRLSLAETAHRCIKPHVSAGGFAIDATVGNGHDTLFLAQAIGNQGKVFGFDIQSQALAATRQRLHQHGVDDRVQLIQASHGDMAAHLPAALKERICAILFNLGYLPGGDKTVITQTTSSLAALATARDWLAVGGILSILAYPGHAGGEQETVAVADWCRQLDPHRFDVETIDSQQPSPQSPRLFLVRRRA